MRAASPGGCEWGRWPTDASASYSGTVFMRILAVGNMYPPQHAGGYEIAWQQAMRHAEGLGHHVRVLTTDHIEDPSRREPYEDVHRTLRWYWDPARYDF